MTTFHHTAMARIDAATMNKGLTPQVATACRQALREANMRGAPLMSAEALASAVRAKLGDVQLEALAG